MPTNLLVRRVLEQHLHALLLALGRSMHESRPSQKVLNQDLLVRDDTEERSDALGVSHAGSLHERRESIDIILAHDLLLRTVLQKEEDERGVF